MVFASYVIWACLQRIVFGDLGQLGYLVQKLVGVELKLDYVPRLRLNEMVEIVQNLDLTSRLAIHNLVQVSNRSAIYSFFKLCSKFVVENGSP